MTNYNNESSRSHTLCRVSIESCSADNRSDRMISMLNLIDLAGSESGSVALTKKNRVEGSYINKSLLTLGAVISKLSECSAMHIPFRDSKLTRLLQSSLSGSGAKVGIVCCITPAGGQVRMLAIHMHQVARATAELCNIVHACGVPCISSSFILRGESEGGARSHVCSYSFN